MCAAMVLSNCVGNNHGSSDILLNFIISVAACHATPVPWDFKNAKLDFYDKNARRNLIEPWQVKRRAQGLGEINMWKSERQSKKTEQKIT